MRSPVGFKTAQQAFYQGTDRLREGGTMTRRHFARTTSIAACFFLSGAESAGCSSTHMDVRSAAADAQFLVDALKCTGSGEFNVTWHGSVPLKQTLNVTEGISVTVTGTDSSRFSLDGNKWRYRDHRWRFYNFSDWHIPRIRGFYANPRQPSAPRREVDDSGGGWGC